MLGEFTTQPFGAFTPQPELACELLHVAVGELLSRARSPAGCATTELIIRTAARAWCVAVIAPTALLTALALALLLSLPLPLSLLALLALLPLLPLLCLLCLLCLLRLPPLLTPTAMALLLLSIGYSLS